TIRRFNHGTFFTIPSGNRYSASPDVHPCLLTVFYAGGPLCDNHSAVTATSLLYPNSSPDFN
ncbi:hypothetical protein OFN31_27865, partial [Escherichia coli]|nr:hypothetical protein [Escherichia coli]